MEGTQAFGLPFGVEGAFEVRVRGFGGQGFRILRLILLVIPYTMGIMVYFLVLENAGFISSTVRISGLRTSVALDA